MTAPSSPQLTDGVLKQAEDTNGSSMRDVKISMLHDYLHSLHLAERSASVPASVVALEHHHHHHHQQQQDRTEKDQQGGDGSEDVLPDDSVSVLKPLWPNLSNQTGPPEKKKPTSKRRPLGELDPNVVHHKTEGRMLKKKQKRHGSKPPVAPATHTTATVQNASSRMTLGIFNRGKRSNAVNRELAFSEEKFFGNETKTVQQSISKYFAPKPVVNHQTRTENEATNASVEVDNVVTRANENPNPIEVVPKLLKDAATSPIHFTHDVAIQATLQTTDFQADDETVELDTNAAPSHPTPVPVPTPNVLRHIDMVLSPEDVSLYMDPRNLHPLSSTPHPGHVDGYFEYLDSGGGFNHFRTPSELSSGSDGDLDGLGGLNGLGYDYDGNTESVSVLEKANDGSGAKSGGSGRMVQLRDTIGMRHHDVTVEKEKLWRRRAW